jgi:hypothetical protein
VFHIQLAIFTFFYLNSSIGLRWYDCSFFRNFSFPNYLVEAHAVYLPVVFRPIGTAVVGRVCVWGGERAGSGGAGLCDRWQA